MTKSIKIKLNHLNNEKATLFHNLFPILREITDRYLAFKKEEIENNKKDLNYSFYKKIREEYPKLNSAVLQQTIRHLDGVIKSYRTWKKKNKNTKFPKVDNIHIHLRNDMFFFEWNEKSKSFDAWLRIFRKHFPLKLCKYHKKSLKNFKKVLGSSIYIDKSGTLCLRLVFETEVEISEQPRKAIGIDIGIERPIVCSDGKMFGNGKLIRHKKLEYAKKRARQQSRKQEIFHKQSRWTADINHKLSRQLINHCLLKGVSVLCLEKLAGTHLSNKKGRRYSWAFNDLLTKIRYKARHAGLSVVNVNPAYTSQTCSSCGLKSKDNRKSQSLFLCSYCGLKKNADVNASINISRLSAKNGLSVKHKSFHIVNQAVG